MALNHAFNKITSGVCSGTASPLGPGLGRGWELTQVTGVWVTPLRVAGGCNPRRRPGRRAFSRAVNGSRPTRGSVPALLSRARFGKVTYTLNVYGIPSAYERDLGWRHFIAKFPE